MARPLLLFGTICSRIIMNWVLTLRLLLLELGLLSRKRTSWRLDIIGGIMDRLMFDNMMINMMMLINIMIRTVHLLLSGS